MANNRMWLCETTTGERILLAKYYPPHWGAWRTQEELEQWFAKFKCNLLFGPTSFILEFETINDPTVAEKRNILSAIRNAIDPNR